jgi:hypothetical protein
VFEFSGINWCTPQLLTAFDARFQSGRYFTAEEADRVKKTGIMFIPRDVVKQAEPRMMKTIQRMEVGDIVSPNTMIPQHGLEEVAV